MREGMRFGGSAVVAGKIGRTCWLLTASQKGRNEREGILLGKSQIPAYPGFAESEVCEGDQRGSPIKTVSNPVEDCKMQLLNLQVGKYLTETEKSPSPPKAWRAMQLTNKRSSKNRHSKAGKASTNYP